MLSLLKNPSTPKATQDVDTSMEALILFISQSREFPQLHCCSIFNLTQLLKAAELHTIFSCFKAKVTGLSKRRFAPMLMKRFYTGLIGTWMNEAKFDWRFLNPRTTKGHMVNI